MALHGASIRDESRRVSLVSARVDSMMPLIEPAIRAAVDDAIPRLGLVNVDAYSLEPELAWSGHGGFFRMHTDTLRHRPTVRVMTVVYYFHKQPKGFAGGRLRLCGLDFRAEGAVCHEIEPRFDRAVFFPSWYPHEVSTVQCRSGAFEDGRFAFTCWVNKTHSRT